MLHIKDHDWVDIFGLACEMRQHRNHMIQTEVSVQGWIQGPPSIPYRGRSRALAPSKPYRGGSRALPPNLTGVDPGPSLHILQG